MSRMEHAAESGDEVAGIVLDQVERLLAQHLTPALLAACDGASGTATWSADLWTALAESGLPLALVPEAEGRDRPRRHHRRPADPALRPGRPAAAPAGDRRGRSALGRRGGTGGRRCPVPGPGR
jgi:hypothetical protein